MTRPLALTLMVGLAGLAQARDAKLVRYPDIHGDMIVFAHMGDIWTAGVDGSKVNRLTVNKARDAYPKFSPDGGTIAFSSDREGNMDIYVIPVEGGKARRLTVHSADETALGWTPDGKGVLFASQRGEGFMGKLYVAPIDGGIPRDAGPDMGLAGSYSPDGTKLAINRKGQQYWRKYYRGAYQTDVTVMDLATKTFKDLTTFDGMDSWPLWARDGFIYFVSDREGKGLTNIYKVPQAGGDAVQVTKFTAGDVRFPGIDAAGKSIVFEHDFGVWRLDLASQEVKPIPIQIAAETQETLAEYRDFNGTADDYDAAPSGKRIVVAVHGDLFTVPTDDGELRQLTDGPARDGSPEFSPDGKLIAFLSGQGAREEMYVIAADGVGEAKKITDVDALKQSYTWSPDSKTIAFTTSEGKLCTVAADGTGYKELVASKYGNVSRPAWSPDGKMLAYSRNDVTRSSDVYILSATGGEERKISFESANEMNPRFSADGTKVYFVRMEGDMGDANARPSSQIFCVPLEKLTKDPEEVVEATAPTPPAADGAPEGGRRPIGGGPARLVVKTPTIDFGGLKRRTRQVTNMGQVSGYIVGNDGKTLFFVGSEGGAAGGGGGRGAALSGAAGGGARSIYSIQDDGKRQTRVAAGTTPTPTPEGDGTPTPPRGGRGGFGGGGPSNLKLTADGRTLYFQEVDGIYSASVNAGGGGGTGAGIAAMMAGGGGRGPGGGRGAAAAAAPEPTAGGGGDKKKINFALTVAIDKPGEWTSMFDDAWRCMKYRFYDAKLHGTDWDAMRDRYRPLVASVADKYELMNVINEMIGELNASHTGAAASPNRNRAEGESAPVPTRHLAIDMVADDASQLFKVAHVYEDGPADKDWIRLAKGNFIVALDGKPLKAGDDYNASLGRRLNKKVELTVNDKPGTEGSWTVKYEPIPGPAYANLRYERWVKERRAKVDELSSGRVGYLHIKAMDQPSLARFRKELAEYRHKEGLVIDQRFNGGGNIEQELLAILVQRPYQVWQPRGTEPTQRPFAGYFGPKVVLQNWRSASNAEMFPAGFRALGLGKVIGTPTMGAVIGTGSYSLIDGSTIRTPGVGVYLADSARTNMENNAVQPDIAVENSPEDNLAGKDRQLETGVAEIMKQLKPGDSVARAGGE